MPMFRKGKKEPTARTWQKHNTSRILNTQTIKGKIQDTLRSLQQGFLTLGSGDLYTAIDVPEDIYNDAYEVALEIVELPEEEARTRAKVDARNEWIAANTCDFLNEVSLLYGLCGEYHAKTYHGANQGYPKGYEYKFPNANVTNAAAYVDAVFGWIEGVIENPDVFPVSEEVQFPKDFVEKHISVVFKRLLRVYAIMYATCLPAFQDIQAERHLNTSFKHFYYFVMRYHLITEQREFDPLLKVKAVKLDDIKRQYNLDSAKHKK